VITNAKNASLESEKALNMSGYNPLNEGNKVTSSSVVTPGAVMAAVILCSAIVIGALIAASIGTATIKDVQNAQKNHCSSFKAFGTPGTSQGGETNPSPREILVNRSKHLVNTLLHPGVGFNLRLGNEEITHYEGLANVATGLPWSDNTLFRMASQSKIVGTALYLAYSFRHNVHTDQQLSDFVPAFANTKVLQPYHPTYLVTEANPLSTANTLTTVTVTTTAAHGLSNGNLVSITGATPSPLSGIPGAEINAIHTIAVTGANTFTFTTTTAATATAAGIGGAAVKIALVVAGVKVTVPYICSPVVRYYTEVPLVQPILMKHVLEHSLGWNYPKAFPLLCAAFMAVDDVLAEAAEIQAQIWVANGIGFVVDAQIPSMPTIVPGLPIQTWAGISAQVPLLFQPGTDFSYGPQLSLLGAVLEVADSSVVFSTDLPPQARTIVNILQDEILNPLDMHDTLFYIQDADPRRADLLSRLAQVYLSYTSIPFNVIFPPFLDFELAYYDASAPRVTAYFDGGLMSTPSDQRKFFDMIARGGTTPNGRRLIGKDMIAEMSQTQNKYYTTHRVTNSYIPHSRSATWGLGTSVVSEANQSPILGGAVSRRAIVWGGLLGSTWSVDFHHDTRTLTFSQSLPAIQDYRRAASIALGARKCVDPSNDPVASAIA
jgi:CubicO group peptidase (beta-lactamase class C family)